MMRYVVAFTVLALVLFILWPSVVKLGKNMAGYFGRATLDNLENKKEVKEEAKEEEHHGG